MNDLLARTAAAHGLVRWNKFKKVTATYVVTHSRHLLITVYIYLLREPRLGSRDFFSQSQKRGYVNDVQ
jgi:hypothetical protein